MRLFHARTPVSLIGEGATYCHYFCDVLYQARANEEQDNICPISKSSMDQGEIQLKAPQHPGPRQIRIVVVPVVVPVLVAEQSHKTHPQTDRIPLSKDVMRGLVVDDGIKVLVLIEAVKVAEIVTIAIITREIVHNADPHLRRQNQLKQAAPQ